MRIAVLASGRGTGFQSIIDHIDCGILKNVEIAVMVTNNPDAGAIARAKKHGIMYDVAFGNMVEIERKLQGIVRTMNIDLIVLAGWMKVLSEDFVSSFPYRIINIHPSLLPKHGGKGMYGIKVHEAVLRSNDKETGCTVHFVIPEVDQGPIIAQKKVPMVNDSPFSLEAKVQIQEHLLYPKAIQLIADKRVKISDGKAMIDLSGNWEMEWNDRQKKYLKGEV